MGKKEVGGGTSLVWAVGKGWLCVALVYIASSQIKPNCHPDLTSTHSPYNPTNRVQSPVEFPSSQEFLLCVHAYQTKKREEYIHIQPSRHWSSGSTTALRREHTVHPFIGLGRSTYPALRTLCVVLRRRRREWSRPVPLLSYGVDVSSEVAKG